MAKLIFTAADVKRVVEHSIAAPTQGGIPDWSKVQGGRAAMNVPAQPNVILVHDQGVYLMSNGEPRDIVMGTRSFCAYAKGCNPDKDEDWHETANRLVGGDDFGDHLDWAVPMKKMLDDGASEIIINFGQKRMSLSAKYPRVSGPQKIVA
jgi:Protein of unknown function (DUF3085)